MDEVFRGPGGLEFPMNVSKAVEGDPVIKQPQAAKIGFVPEVAFRWMFSGPSNSGKTNLARWVLDKYYIEKPGTSFFERIYLFSPTGKLDPVWKDLNGLRPSDRITELSATGRDRLKDIFEAGLRRTKTLGKDRAHHELVIFDDAIGDIKFLNSDYFFKSFIAGRHGNISCMVMTQSYIKVPRSVRMQITALAMFPSRITEIERLCDEHGPVNMSKNDFCSMVKYAIKKSETDKYPFFFIDTNQPEETRYRRCLTEFLSPTGEGDGTLVGQTQGQSLDDTPTDSLEIEEGDHTEDPSPVTKKRGRGRPPNPLRKQPARKRARGGSVAEAEA
jgi:hypothetical protein